MTDAMDAAYVKNKFGKSCIAKHNLSRSPQIQNFH